MTIEERLGIIKAPSYHTIPVKHEPSAPDLLKRYKSKDCTRQLAIYADERKCRSGLKTLRCIITCYSKHPSYMLVFDEHGNKVGSYWLKKNYAERLPQKDARMLARVKRNVPVIVERF